MDELRVVTERLKGFLDETGLRFDLKSGYRKDGKQYYEYRRERVEKNIIYYEDGPGHMLYEPDPSGFYRPSDGKNKRIRWPNDWIDPYPPTIDLAYIYDDHISITIENEFSLRFMCGEYYAISLPGVMGSTMYTDLELYMLKERADRMKAARFIPAKYGWDGGGRGG